MMKVGSSNLIGVSLAHTSVEVDTRPHLELMNMGTKVMSPRCLTNTFGLLDLHFVCSRYENIAFSGTENNNASRMVKFT